MHCALSSALLVSHIELLQVLVEAVSHQNLATALPALHLHNHLAACHLDLLLFHLLATLLHLVDLLFVAKLLSLSLLPLFVGDSRHDLHGLFLLLLLLFGLALVVVLDLLVARVSLLLDQAVFQPVLECSVALLLFDLFMQALLFLLTQLLLLLESLLD